MATDWRELVTFRTTPGGSDETVTVFQATGVSATETAFAREAEEADIEVRWVALDDIVSGVLAGRLQNSILAIAALAATPRADRAPTGRPRMTTIEEAVDRYLRHVTVERGLSANTVAAYRRDLALWQGHLEEARRASPGTSRSPTWPRSRSRSRPARDRSARRASPACSRR